MKIRIYQINLDRDKDRVAFLGYGDLVRLYGHRTIDREIYDLVYEGDVACIDLEHVYQLFNCGPAPDGYTGRSMSVSDVVEVIESDTVEPGSYFCDSLGFKHVEFRLPAAEPRNEESESDSDHPRYIEVMFDDEN